GAHMKRSALLAGVGAGIGAGVMAARRVVSARDRSPSDRHLAVTVNRPVEEVAPNGVVPEPLGAVVDDLGGAVDVDVRPAPGDRGTERHVLVHDEVADRAGDVRVALRDTKALLETGLVMRADVPDTSRATALNAPLRAAEDHAKEVGVS